MEAEKCNSKRAKARDTAEPKVKEERKEGSTNKRSSRNAGKRAENDKGWRLGGKSGRRGGSAGTQVE